MDLGFVHVALGTKASAIRVTTNDTLHVSELSA